MITLRVTLTARPIGYTICLDSKSFVHNVDPPKSITVEFDNGHQLEVFDSSSDFESIQPSRVIV